MDFSFSKLPWVIAKKIEIIISMVLNHSVIEKASMRQCIMENKFFLYVLDFFYQKNLKC